MRFDGPTACDLRNISALNRAFLIATGPATADRALTVREINRLASAPFLLFSLREHDADYWHEVLADGPQADLLEPPPGNALRVLQTAALGFAWQLARSNPYVARLVCGAPPEWCESLADRTLMDLLDAAAGRCDLLVPRFEAEDPVTQRLLASGALSDRRVRRMAQHLALQSMLTHRLMAPYRQFRSAACGLRSAPRRVAERETHRKV